MRRSWSVPSSVPFWQRTDDGHTRSVSLARIGGGDERIIEEDRFVAAGQHIVWHGRMDRLAFILSYICTAKPIGDFKDT